MNYLLRNRQASLLTLVIKRNSSVRPPDNDPMLRSRDNLPIIKEPAFVKQNIKKLKRSITIANIIADRKRKAQAQRASAAKRASGTMTNLVQKRGVHGFPDPISYDQPPPSDHIVILPEEILDLDSAEILRLPKKGEPELNFSKFTPESVFKGASKVVLGFEYFCSDYNSNIIAKPETIGQFFRSIEEHLYPMQSAITIMMILTTLDPDNYRHTSINQLMDRYYDARNSRTRGAFCNSLEGFIARDGEKFGPIERKMLIHYNMPHIERAQLKNLESVTVKMSRENLYNEMLLFERNVLQANNNFSHTVDDPDILSAMSNDLDECSDLHHKERTPFHVTVSTYKKFMQVCPDRFVRQMLWQTYHKRCSPKGPARLSNRDIIKSIRSLQRGIADKLGYRTHAEFRRQGSMIESRLDVIENLKSINEDNKEKLTAGLTELNDFASDNKFYDPSGIGIQEYDLDYWMQKYMYDVIIGFNERDIKTFFPLHSVIRGMQKFFEEYHDIKLKPTRPAGNAPGLTKQDWTTSLQYFDVSDKNGPLGTIILDPYCRSTKSMSEMLFCQLRVYSKQLDCLPSRLISASFKPDPTTQKAYLSISEVIDIFKHFAVAVQELMFRYDYAEINQNGAFEVEARNLFPQYCIGQLMTDHKIIQACSERGDSKPIDAELANRILKAKAFTKPFKTWHDLYIGHFDLEVHTRLDDVQRVAQEVYSIYSPFPRDPDNYDYCAMIPVFLGPDEATHYGKLCSKQLANFCLQNGPPGTADLQSRRDYNVKLRQSLFAPDKFDTGEKLLSLTGCRFKFSETSLGVL